jgi:hypothetical protein
MTVMVEYETLGTSFYIMIFSSVGGGENHQATYYELKVHWTFQHHTHVSFEFTTLA